MKKIKQLIEIIKCNMWQLIGFECTFKLLTLFIFTPLFLKMFNLIMKVTGYSYLTIENIVSFLLNPITLFMLIILILLMTIYTMFDITTIIIILDASYQKKKIKVIDAVRISISKCIKIFNIKNISLAILVLFLIPFLNIGITSNFISTIKIPEFIFDFIVHNKVLFSLTILIIILLIVLLLRWIYSLHYFVLEDCKFKEARRKSAQLGKKHHIKDLLTIFVFQFINTIIYLIFIIFGILIILLLDKELADIIVIKSISTTIIWIFIAFSFIVFSALTTPVSYAIISILFYFNKTKRNEEIKFIKLNTSKNNQKKNKKLKIAVLTLTFIAIITGSIFTYEVYTGNYNLNIEYVRRIEVTAHRGASFDYPENTLSAFRGAKEMGADWIELDVQQTKDGKIIVIHDANFKRTTGVNKNTWELTYDEVKKLDAGSFFDEKFKGEKIPLLEEVVEFAKNNNIKLNIELKPNGHEIDFEKNVIDIIKDMNFDEECVIISQVYEVLENIKKYNKNIKTVYVMSLAYGDIISLNAADGFSIEATSVTNSLVEKIHKQGKELYVWTLNTLENINKMIDLRVDNIITDNITLTKEAIYSSKTSNLINEYIKIIEKIF